ncbi:MAG: acetylornithine/succinylornithine family transaminase [Chloroflexota bacterium]|jgi:predicted acetylornithine/succinylornithine family transaminase|nr:acetylornithine/succinylornithine family transaminase [Chloroflexota bacterium]MDP6758260.1 acetylornithine/succinylornithine family transaminase [Chloroflexota bacterium]
MNQATDWPAVEKQYYAPTFGRAPETFVRGQGTRLWDDTGKEYLDFVAGIATNTLGHSHPDIAAALYSQARTLVHTSSLYHTVPQLELAQLLLDDTCLDRIFYVNSGGEATETAMKAARKHGKLNRDGAYEVITTNRSFHGRTLATTAATGTRAYQVNFDPMPEGFGQVEYNDLDAMRAAISDTTCAIMVELVQGEGGIWPGDGSYIEGLRELCDEDNLLLIFDEVQTGIGRLGSFYGYQHYGVEPDIITLAKGLGGGVPIGATLFKEDACTLRPGDHGNTFGGSPLMCAAAKVVVEAVQGPGFLDAVIAKGQRVRSGLEALRDTGKVFDVRGVGLLNGVQFDSPDTADHVVAQSRADGLILVKVDAATVRLVPPLNVEDAEIDQAVAIIGGTL